MMRHYPHLGSASDWLCYVGNLIQPIRSPTHIWVVTRHQYGISELVSQTSFGEETSGSVAKCRLFSLAKATDGRKGSCCVRVGSGVRTVATTPNNVETCSASWEGYNP